MLKLKNIVKDYQAGDNVVHALRRINVTFNETGIIGILGPSGCGKSTMLNIIGGLDKYTSGDLIINGRSTSTYTDKDWDTYRNHSIGFIFQQYNLVPHLNLLENVELALTIAGLTSKEKRDMSKKALEIVGLGGVENKKPNQLSGGQQQRVAIARAIVNNPDIILADEPTGALDSETSVQVMEILKEIGKTKLVIMVTHNPELAKLYSDRIINMKDGQILGDTAPLDAEDEIPQEDDKKRPSMGFWTACKLSFKNLISKKGRTLTTGFAGSIGIIGIGLILSLSTGTTNYMNHLLNSAIETTPITVSSLTFSADTVTNIVSNTLAGVDFPDPNGGITPMEPVGNLFETNHITEDYVEYVSQLENPNGNMHYAVNVAESMSIDFNMFRDYENNPLLKGNVAEVDTTLLVYTQEMPAEHFEGIPQSLVETHYDNISNEISASHYPTKVNELALIVDANNGVSTKVLDALDIPYLDDNGQVVEKLNFDKIIGHQFKIFLNDALYKQNGDGEYKQDLSQSHLREVYDAQDEAKKAVTLEITAVLRQKKSVVPSLILLPGIGYTPALTQFLLSDHGNGQSEVVVAQRNSPDVNVLNGDEFNSDPSRKQIEYENVLKKIGGIALPDSIRIYCDTQANKDKVIAHLDAWNADEANYDHQMNYSDSLATTSTLLNEMMDLVTLVLGFFSGISLVVSSVMIGIITYVSVIERTKEIGVLRALGASKRNIREVFNAETVIIGFLAGVIGIIFAYLIQLIINAIFLATLNIWGIAHLTILQAVLLILISTALTSIAGLIPSAQAARKDPVTCLRNE